MAVLGTWVVRGWWVIAVPRVRSAVGSRVSGEAMF